MLTVAVISQHILLPLLILFWMSGRRYVPLFNVRTRIEARALFAAFAFYMAFILVCGAWPIVGYWLRPLILALFAVAATAFFRGFGGVPREPAGPATWLKTSFFIATAALFCVYFIIGVAGWRQPREAVDLAFPLAGGLYVVGQGGAAPIINHHYAFKSQRHALDLEKIGAAGFRAAGIFPKDPSRYEVFGDVVTSPCDGRVVFARDGLEDAVGAQTEAERPAGNVVALECAGATVFLAHLAKGSLAVKEGQTVVAGDALGRVGNSGNTTEPHLHIHAERGPFAGEFSQNPGLAMRFDGRVLVRGSLFFNPG